MKLKLTLTSALCFAMVGCMQIQPEQPTRPTQPPVQPETKPKPTIDGAKTTPYQVGEITRQPVTVPVTATNKPIQPQPVQTVGQDGSELGTYKTLYAQAQQALQQKKLDRAEQLGLQVQRIAPQAAQSYLLLAHVAVQKNKLPQAKSLAQRGVSLANNATTQKQLWQIILQVAQQQNDALTIQKAQTALASL